MSSPEDAERSPKRQKRTHSPSSPSYAHAQETPQTPPPSVHMSPSWPAQQLPGLQYSAAGATFPTPPSTAGFPHMARGGSSDGFTPDDSIAIDDPDDHPSHPPLSSAPTLALFKLHTTPISPALPHPTHNLIQLYDLTRIATSVARRDPTTGEKLVKLRKSYEGKVKELNIEGRTKAERSDKGAVLQDLLHPAWDNIAEDTGKTWWQSGEHMQPALSESEGGLSKGIEMLLGSALDMAPGRLPAREHAEWKLLLGLEDGSKVAPVSRAPVPGATVRAVQQNTAASPPPALPATRAQVARPERAGKKRRYDESSYAGYDEGYEDDRFDEGGGGNKRVKRKESNAFSSASNSPAFSSAPSGVGVGVKSA